MTDARTNDYHGWIGRNAVDPNGDKIGKIEEIYADDDSGQPAWLVVHTGMFGRHVSFVPLHGWQAQGGDVMVAYDKDLVKDAPRAEADGHLSPQEEDRLYEHYGVGGANWSAADANDRADLRGTVGRGADAYDTSGRTTDGAMARSEGSEGEDHAGEQRREAGRTRLRKWVETEQVQRAVLQGEPVQDAAEPIIVHRVP
jgi:hypothetical protein